MTNNFKAGDIVVNILNGKIGKIIEKYTLSTNPYYADFRLRYKDETHIVKARHMRYASQAEKRKFENEIRY